MDCIECRVVDTGPGIPFEQQQKVFEAFRQIDSSDSRKHGGTGLGLALCRDMIEAMDGRIWVESRAGEGSSFVFVLPVATEKRRGSLTDGTGRSLTSRSIRFGARDEAHGPTVAVCLQESGATEQVAALLKKTGYRVLTADSGTALLGIARRRLPRAVISDMHLPDMNGWQILGALRASTETRPIGMLLASALAPAAGQAIRDGYGGCVELKSPLAEDHLLTWLSTLTEVEDRPPARLVLVGFDGEFVSGLAREGASCDIAAFRCDSAADAVKEIVKREPALLAWRPTDLDPTQHSLVRALCDLGLDAPPVVIVGEETTPGLESLVAMPGVEFQTADQATAGSLVRLVMRLSCGDAADPALPGDPLTGLPGRDYLERRLSEEQHRADRYGRPFSVLTFSITDGGKGGGIPSPVQRSAAQALRRALRVCDVIGRTAPGVFVALLPETTREAAEGARQRLLSLLPSGEVFGYPYACRCWSHESSATGSPTTQLDDMFAETE
jgi:CheY-like chemotaxis protein